MDSHYVYTPYIWPMLAPAVFTAALVIFVWRRRSVPGAWPLTLAMLFTIPWEVGAALEVAAVDVSTKISWVKFQAIWILPVNTAVLCFVLEYADRGRWLTRRTLTLLAIPPLLYLFLILTNNTHHWLWLDYQFNGLKVTVEGRSIEIPVFVLPGTAANAIVLHTGWGRRRAGRVGRGRGFDVYPVRTAASAWLGKASVAKTGASYDIVSVQDHHVVDDLGKTERDRRALHLIREADLEYFEKHPDFAQHMVHLPGEIELWNPHPYEGYKWGMTIDLNACTGCNACVIGCESENNIPIVGKDQVLNGREMHWIRGSARAASSS